MRRKIFNVSVSATAQVCAESEEQVREMLRQLSQNGGRSVYIEGTRKHELGWVYGLVIVNEEDRLECVGEE